MHQVMEGKLNTQENGTTNIFIDISLAYMPRAERNKIQQNLNRMHSRTSALASPSLLGSSSITEQRARRDLIYGPEPLYLSHVFEGAS